MDLAVLELAFDVAGRLRSCSPWGGSGLSAAAAGVSGHHLATEKRRDGDPCASMFRTVHVTGALRPDSPLSALPGLSAKRTRLSARSRAARKLNLSTNPQAATPLPPPLQPIGVLAPPSSPSRTLFSEDRILSD